MTISLDSMPRLERDARGTRLMVDGKPFIMLAGELRNSSASSLEYMAPIWPRLAQRRLNTVLVTASWELVEPVEGEVRFELIDGLLEQARAHGLRLVFLWFGTWKNAVSDYAPEWVKTDLRRFPRAQKWPGRNSDSISSFSEAACAADARAFAAFMRHLREVDGQERTTLAIQVENEVGLLGAPRDVSPPARAAFEGPPPAELLEWLRHHEDRLLPETRAMWDDRRAGGTWTDVFGPWADEAFMAWHYARFVDRVTAAGKAEYPLPMYANAWLIQHDDQAPGGYPSGGPVTRMMDIWRAGAPAIDLLAPDIYRQDFARICARYARGGNPLFIPETRREPTACANVLYAIGQHDALCFAPFGIDSMDEKIPLAETYDMLTRMMPLIHAHRGTDRMIGLLPEGGARRRFELGRYVLEVEFVTGEALPPGALVIAAQPEEFYVVGHGVKIAFAARPGDLPNVGFLSLEEGEFHEGQWSPRRRMNGDELKVVLGGSLSALRARLYSYE